MDPNATQKKSGILGQYHKFKMEGKKLKEAQKISESLIQSRTLEKTKAEAMFKELILKNRNIKNQMNIIECQRNQLEETMRHEKILTKGAEQQHVELRRKITVAGYILETEEMNKNYVS